MAADKKENKALHSFIDGTNSAAYEYLGAHYDKKQNKYVFRAYAPKAERLFLAGDFNGWKLVTPMQKDNGTDIRCVAVDVKEFRPESKYKFVSERGERLCFEPDPFAFRCEGSPNNASMLYDEKEYKWHDDGWMKYRKKSAHKTAVNVYELAAESWAGNSDEGFSGYIKLCEKLCGYVKSMGYTHVALRQVTGTYGCRGKQAAGAGLFCPSSLCESPNTLKCFVDRMHEAGVGVIFDMPKICLLEENSLFDYNLSDRCVKSILMSSLCFWIKEYHADGIKLDGCFCNTCGGGKPEQERELTDNILQEIAKKIADVLLIVDGKDGDEKAFSYVRDLEFTKNVLQYMSQNPALRGSVTERINLSDVFGTKCFVPTSLAGTPAENLSLMDMTFGDYWQKFASARAFMTFVYAVHGHKWSFMGNEIAQFKTWEEGRSPEWFLLDYESHSSFKRFVRELNFVYLENKALHMPEICEEACSFADDGNVLCMMYKGRDKSYVGVIVNFTPQGRYGCKVPVSKGGEYIELINSDDRAFGGSGASNPNTLEAFEEENGYALKLDIGPYGASVIRRINKSNNN